DRRDTRRPGGSTFDSRRPAGQRPGRQRTDGAGAPVNFRGRDEDQERRLPPGLEVKPGEPSIPPGTDIHRLDRAVRAELRSLPKDLAEVVAGHLLLAGELIDEDPERAYAHAEAARRRAARLPIVREGAAETAYAAGKYDVALGEYRALRRMTGSADYLPVMADCERALGRPHQALRLVREAAGQPMDPGSAVELRIIEAGARHDLGQTAEAARLLRVAIGDLGRQPTSAAMRLPAARLHYALGDVLLDLGDATGGRREFVTAATLDTDGDTDARERVDTLDGLDIQFDDDDDADDDDDHGTAYDGHENTDTDDDDGPDGRG
ncbi:MAG: tetratricopeptide repeat protein, partial [Microlunatus sp.]|nr:tetratricopeptide repeat protein [Microlunatus sp.]